MASWNPLETGDLFPTHWSRGADAGGLREVGSRVDANRSPRRRPECASQAAGSLRRPVHPRLRPSSLREREPSRVLQTPLTRWAPPGAYESGPVSGARALSSESLRGPLGVGVARFR